MTPLSRAAFYTSVLTAFNPVLTLVSGHGDGAQPSKCSTYTNTINLPFDVKLEYVSSETTLSVRMSSPRQSYLSFGISDINGRMKNSEAVIGTMVDTGGADIFGTSSVELYALSDAAVRLITDPSRKTLMDTSFKQDDLGSVLEFKKLLSDGTGNKDILGNGMNKFIWSSGFSNDLSFGHADAYGRVEISLSPCVEDGTSGGHGNTTTIAKRNDKNLFLIHGILAIISFAFLIPLSIIAAFLRKCKQLHFLNTYTIFDKKIWFVIHTMANVVSYIFVVVMFGLSLRAVKAKGGIHFHNTHMVLGLITILLLTVQVVFALVRPPSPGAVAAAAAAASDDAKDNIENGQTSDDDDNNKNNGTENSNGTENDTTNNTNNKKSCFPSLRKIWGRSHRLFAVLIFIFGLWQIHTGISLYQDMYAIEKNYIPLYWIVLSSLFFVSVGLVVYLKKFYS